MPERCFILTSKSVIVSDENICYQDTVRQNTTITRTPVDSTDVGVIIVSDSSDEETEFYISTP